MIRKVVSALALTLALVACGQQDQSLESQIRKIAAEEAKKEEAAARVSEAFLAQNRTKEGVKVTASGLQYKVLRSGPANGRTPKVGDQAGLMYEGKLVDGKVFDSSYERKEPAVFPVGVQGIIAGFGEALQLMKPGDMYEIYLPPQLAYGEAGRPPEIGPNQALIFKVEFLGYPTKKEGVFAPTPEAAPAQKK